MEKINVLIVALHPYRVAGRSHCADRLPLGPLYALAAARRARPRRAELLDLTTVGDDFDFEAQLRDIQPGLVGLGIHSSAMMPLARELARCAKKYSAEVCVVAGGVHASSKPEDCLKGSDIDCVLRGEVDDSLAQLVDCIQTKNRATIPGLFSKANWNFPATPSPATTYPDLDRLPRVPEPGFDISRYSLLDPLVSANAKTLNVASVRGCPNSCAYCSYRVVGNQRRRARNASLLAADLRSLADEYGIKQFNFVDDSFLCSPKRTLQFCRQVSGDGFIWRCQSRVDDFTSGNLQELTRELVSAGCRMISFGLESGDLEVLRHIRKPIDLEWAKTVCKSLIRAGIRVRIYVMVGLPYQTRSSIAKTQDLLRAIKPTSVSVEMFVPHPGSVIGDDPGAWGVEWENSDAEARIQRWDWLFDIPARAEPCIHTQWMSAREIADARDELLAEWPAAAQA